MAKKNKFSYLNCVTEEDITIATMYNIKYLVFNYFDCSQNKIVQKEMDITKFVESIK